MTARSYPGGRPSVAEQHALTRRLESLALRVEDALGEFYVGAAAGDVVVKCAAARRLESLGALMGEDVRKFERGSGGRGRAAEASAAPAASRQP